MNMEFDYLSDQALEELIACSEEQGLLSAPRTLKGEILAQAEAQAQTLAEQARGRMGKTSRQRQFVDYCLRVALATAACLVLLFAGGSTLGNLSQSAQQNPALTSTAQRFGAFTDQVEEGYRDLNQKLSQLFTNFDFGGNRNE